MDEVEQSHSKTSPSVKIRLYRNASDFEIKYLTEVEVARLPCGSLNLYDLPPLFQIDRALQVSPIDALGGYLSICLQIVDNIWYKPILITNGKVPHNMLDILLHGYDYICVTFRNHSQKVQNIS